MSKFFVLDISSQSYQDEQFHYLEGQEVLDKAE